MGETAEGECHPDDAVGRFEAALRRAAAEYVETAARRGEATMPGILPGCPETAGDSDGSPGGRTCAERVEALRREDARMLRQFRSGRPGHDLSRHLALRRRLAALAEPVGEATGVPLSGAELNGRFRHPRRRGDQPARARRGAAWPAA